MDMILQKVRAGRLLWTVVVTAYFLVFFRNFFVDALAGGALWSVLFAWAFVAWLAVEYCYGSPFFQSGVVEASAFWRGAFAFFVYPFLGYAAADQAWWHWTQMPLPPLVAWFPGMVLFTAGTVLRLATLRELVRAAGKAGRSRERGVFDARPFRLCRHPRYFATMLQLVGAALVFNSWGALVLAGVVGLPLILVQARYEDAGLAQLLKGDFRRHAEQVPLFWPRLRRVRQS